MAQDLWFRDYVRRTAEACFSAIAQSAQSYDTSPDQLSEEQVRQF